MHYSQKLIFSSCRMKISSFFVDKECVRNPYLINVFCPNNQFFKTWTNVERETLVPPKLTEVHIQREILQIYQKFKYLGLSNNKDQQHIFSEISHVKLNSWWCIMKLFQCSLHTMLCFLGIYEYIFTSYWYSKIIENLLYANPPVQREMHWKYFFIKLTMRYVRQKSYICALQYSLMRISHFTLYLKAKSKKTYL